MTLGFSRNGAVNWQSNDKILLTCEEVQDNCQVNDRKSLSEHLKMTN